jgi:hypothetical protein
MIEVHAAPIAAIEQREKDRVAAIQERIAAMNTATESEYPLSSHELAARLKTAKAVVIDDTFAEFIVAAARAKDSAVTRLEVMLAAVQKQEADQAELERLRREAEARAIADREEQIRKEATERAEWEAETRRDAEKKATDDARAREIEAAEKRELELKLAAERSEREKVEAVRRAEFAEKEAQDKIRCEKEAAAAQEQTRREDKEKMAAVKKEILAAIKGKTAAEVVDALVAGQIPFTRVTF